MINVGIYGLVNILVFAGIIWLQVLLSKKENRWLGLILPIISLLYSIFVISLVSTYSYNMETGELVSMLPNPLGVLFIFILLNIPTLIFILIYLSQRKQIKRRKQLDTMTIQDL